MRLKFCVFLWGVASAWGNETGQYLPGTMELLEKKLPLETIEGESESGYIQGGVKKSILDSTPSKTNFLVPHSSKKEMDFRRTREEKILYPQNRVSGDYKDRDDLYSISDESLSRELRRYGKSSFSLYFAVDEMEYKNSNSSFETTYRSGSKKGGMILVSLSSIKRRDFLNYNYGFLSGFGYNYGDGVFKSSPGTPTDMTFKLFSIPIDFFVGLNMTLSRFFSFSINAGPSILGLLQSRDDVQDGDERRHRRQVGYGMASNASLSFALSEIYPRDSRPLFYNNQVTQHFVDIYARYVNYSGFKEDQIHISGLAFGIGFTYEYH